MDLIGYPGQNSAISDLLAGRVQFMQHSPEDFAQLLKDEIARWKKVVKDSNIVVD